MSSRRKGRHYENDFAKRYGGTRISETGMPGPDVAIWTQGDLHPATLFEVKYRDKISTLNWHDQATSEDAFLVMRRAYDTTYYITHPVNQPCPCPLKEVTE